MVSPFCVLLLTFNRFVWQQFTYQLVVFVYFGLNAVLGDARNGKRGFIVTMTAVTIVSRVVTLGALMRSGAWGKE